VIHRVVAVLRHGHEYFVLQKGDAPGRLTLTHADAIAGKAVSVLRPAGRAFPALETLDPDMRARFEAARRACRPYVALWTTAHRLGAHRVAFLRGLVKRCAEVLLPGAPSR
jgi:hypothetical protein